MQVKYKDFFASANSGRGFINMFGKIFKNTEHLYIIKGGSGTGKSSLMKKAAAYAEKEGENVEYIYCSSDPDSLDGVIIHGKETGILDGTSPHTSDTLYPGAYDEIVNTGEFWNTDTLISNKDEITHLSDLKKELYNRAYLYLNAALSCETLAHGISSSAINKEKLDRAVCRLLKQIEPSVKGERKIRLTEGITMKGYVNLHSYKCCKNIYTINDTYNIGCEYLSAIDKLLTQKGIGHTVSYSPLDTTKLNLIHIEENDTLFVPYKYENTKKYINTERFINKSYINKNEINRAIKHRNNLINEAYYILAQIKDVHFELEKIYISAMDFNAMNRYEETLLSKIFK